jgi:hypothetical protein
MRPNELANLDVPYTDDDARPLDDRFVDALGLGLRHLRRLRSEVDRDQDEAHHGIRWWAIPLKHRVLIGDFLLDSISGVEVNLVEAQLHYWELLDWSDRDAEFIGRSQIVPGAQPPVRLPPRTAPKDDLPAYLINLHTAGILRALGSALDCLAAVIVGVLPLPRPIMKSSFTRDLLSALDTLPTLVQARSPGERVQGGFRDAFLDELRKAGPEHWHEWVIGYRNMLMHRGRRKDTSTLVPRPGPPVRVGVERVLPADPELSQVEAWARWGDLIGCGQGSYCLQERAEETLRRAVGAVARLAARTCELLERVWHERRCNPLCLPQPERQWVAIPSIPPCGFAGFLPGSFASQPDALIGNPGILRRMRIAALDNESSNLWRVP